MVTAGYEHDEVGRGNRPESPTMPVTSSKMRVAVIRTDEKWRRLALDGCDPDRRKPHLVEFVHGDDHLAPEAPKRRCDF